MIAAVVCSMSMWAVVATPEPIEYTKPDGTKVMARVYGDEFHSFIESLDGQLLSGTRSEEVMERAAKARAARRVAQGAGSSAFPTTGSPRSLVLLVGFKDLKFDQKLSDFDALLNQEGYDYNGATGSCRDYYTASSFGLFTPHFDVYGPYTLTRDVAFYGAETDKDNDANPGAMVAEACQMAYAAGVNFADYDTNDDGVLDNVFIYYAGHNQAEGGPAYTIWPHQGSIASRDIILNGVRVDSYACTSEYRGYTGKTRCGIGTFCHEFGHVIGQPDFYDTNYKYYSVGDWDIMCSGSYNNQGRTPPTFTAYERFYEGWLEPEQLTTPGTYILTPLESSNKAFLVAADQHNLNGKQPNPSEFFMLEYRDGNGWDSGLPGHGLLVWHIDFLSSAWTSNTPNNGVGDLMRMHLEEANGIGWRKRANGEGGRSSDPYPGTNNVTSFMPTLHDQTSLSMPFFEIKEDEGSVSFVFISSGSTNISMDKQDIALLTTLDDKNNVAQWEPQEVTIAGSSLAPDKPVTITVQNSVKNTTYRLYAGENYPKQNSSEWTSTLNLYPNADSTLMQKVWVSFVPKKIICESVGAILAIDADGAMASLKMTANAPRVISVTAPVLKAAEQITPYSFIMNWKPVKDADMYYFNIYSVEDGTSAKTQSFEDFNSQANIELQGWKSTSTTRTTSSKSDGTYALVLKENGDYVETEIYAVSVTAVSFWISAMAGTVDTVGYINLEAYNGQQWKTLESTNITKRTKNKTLDYTFNASDNYVRFRITFYGKESNGIALDAFTATLNKNIKYLYQGDELHVDAWDDPERCKLNVGDLEPGKTYCYQIRCNDGGSYKGGCTDNLSDFSKVGKVTTVDLPELIKNNDHYLPLTVDSINYDPKTHVVYVSAPKEGDAIGIYDRVGSLCLTIPVHNNVYEYAIPSERFVSGVVYTLKYLTDGKVNRQDKVIKAIFRK